MFPAQVQQLVLIKVETPDVDQQDPALLNIKEEDDEPWTSLEEGDQLSVKEETDVPIFSVTPFPLKSEDDEEKPSFSHLHQHQVEDKNIPTSSSANWMDAAAVGEDCGGGETPWNSNVKIHKDDFSPSETDVSEDDEDGDLSDSGPKVEDTNKDWKESRSASGIDTVSKSLSCSVRREQYVNNQSLQSHMTCHSDVRPSSFNKKCVEINKNVESHRKVQAKPRMFSCDVCGKSFAYKSKINAHVRSHTGDKPFPCDVCGQRFSYSTSLKAHMRIHTGDKPYLCNVCGQRFSHMTNLNAHVRIHTGDKPFSCEFCGQRFSQKGQLNLHTKIHTGDKPFSCEVCGQTFRQKSYLNSHMRIHTGDKPFSCDVCGQRFSQKSNLNKHMRIHTGDKLFSCDDCGQSFSQKSNLSKHMRIHTKEKNESSCKNV
ncbi:zinc finger protein 664 [Nematolebias whitei]|uniref:zinc finger protein 664 n=1 Tax=Nematolebias whitei TaxID=451745 RepID=UPI00189B77C9|nr:zinc finger protein 664 [Nematolebias whitei]